MPQLRPRQIRTLDTLLAIGAERPRATEGFAEEVISALSDAMGGELSHWNGSGFFLSKSRYLEQVRCQGLAVARASESAALPGSAILRGKVAHRAIQISYTHPDVSIDGTVKDALASVCAEDADMRSFWEAAAPSTQSDILVAASSALTNFLDDFPPLDPAWSPRFEEPMAARVGHLRLSVRADLMLGRPRGDNVRTLLILDFKSGQLSELHRAEAEFYALVACIRYGVSPWRSSVFSLADGTFTDPDISESELLEVARKVGAAAASQSSLMMERSFPILSPGDHCRFCPVKFECGSSEFKL